MKQKFSNHPELTALVTRAQNGDRDAMEALYVQSYPALYRTVRAICREESTVADVLQESYLQAFSHLSTLRDPAQFRPWLRRIAVNELRQQLRKKQPLSFSDLSQTPELPLPEPIEQNTPETRLEEKERAAQLQQLLDRLPDGQRAALVLYYGEQLSVREIAAALEVSEGTVKTQLHLGRKRLAAALRDSSLTLPAALPLLFSDWPAAQPLPSPRALPESLPAQLAERGAALTVKSTRSVLLGRLALGAAVLAAVGGLGYGASRLVAARAHYGDVQPPSETIELHVDAEPAEPPATVPTEPTAPAQDHDEDDPTEPTEPPETTEPTEPPATPGDLSTPPAPTEPEESQAPASQESGPPASQPSTPAVSPTEAEAEGDASGVQPASSGNLGSQDTLPTENPLPFAYQELSLHVGETWTGSFPADEEWLVTIFAHTPNLSETSNVWWSSLSDGVQSVAIQLNTPGTYTYSLCRNNGQFAWTPWVKITVLPAESAG